MSAAARAPGRRPRFQQRAYVLRVRTADHHSLVYLCIMYMHLFICGDFNAMMLHAYYLNNEMLFRGN